MTAIRRVSQGLEVKKNLEGPSGLGSRQQSGWSQNMRLGLDLLQGAHQTDSKEPSQGQVFSQQLVTLILTSRLSSSYICDPFSCSQGRVRSLVKRTRMQAWADLLVIVLLPCQRILTLPFRSHALSENLDFLLFSVLQGVQSHVLMSLSPCLAASYTCVVIDDIQDKKFSEVPGNALTHSFTLCFDFFFFL